MKTDDYSWRHCEIVTDKFEQEVLGIILTIYYVDDRIETQIICDKTSLHNLQNRKKEKQILNGTDLILEKYKKKYPNSLKDITEEKLISLIIKWTTQISLNCNIFNSNQLLYIANNYSRLSLPVIGSFANTPLIKILDFSNNLFTEIPSCISQLKNLEELYMSHNLITEIPNHFCNGGFNNLMILVLSNNKIMKISNDINNLTELRVLNLNNNYLSDIPHIILPKLIILILCYNNFPHESLKLFYKLGRLFADMCKVNKANIHNKNNIDNYDQKHNKINNEKHGQIHNKNNIDNYDQTYIYYNPSRRYPFKYIKPNLISTRIAVLEKEKNNDVMISVISHVSNTKMVNKIIFHYQKIYFRMQIHRIFGNKFPEEIQQLIGRNAAQTPLCISGRGCDV